MRLIDYDEYPKLIKSLDALAKVKGNHDQAIMHSRNLAKNDLYFLIRFILNRKDLSHRWLFDRCREVQDNPNGCLDLWAREHYKSTIITLGLTIQNILNDPELTIGIFSDTSSTAEKFLFQIKREFESNEMLKVMFPDILYLNPQAESPAWNNSAITVKRKSNPKEATVSAFGLVNALPTGSHFKVMIYDDIVTEESVRSPGMREKILQQLELSYPIGTEDGVRRMIGTRYHAKDAYSVVLRRGTFIERIHPATKNGKADGEPVLLSRESLATKRRDYGEYTFNSQMLLNPSSDKTMGFKREWVRYMESVHQSHMNVYLMVDPAGEKKRSSDHTAMAVIGLGADRNYYLLDFVYDKLSLKERTEEVMRLHQKWRPLKTGYEKYGKDSDIEHIISEQERVNYRFEIIPLGGRLSKIDRIMRLQPIFENRRFYMPRSIERVQYDGRNTNLIEQLLDEEYDSFPLSVHDDGMDCIARILDEQMGTIFPSVVQGKPPPMRYPKRSIA